MMPSIATASPAANQRYGSSRKRPSVCDPQKDDAADHRERRQHRAHARPRAGRSSPRTYAPHRTTTNASATSPIAPSSAIIVTSDVCEIVMFALIFGSL